MAALRVTRLLLALGVLQAAGRSLVVCVNWNPESVEIARGKPIVATSTCGAVASEKYCYSTGKGTADIISLFIHYKWDEQTYLAKPTQCRTRTGLLMNHNTQSWAFNDVPSMKAQFLNIFRTHF